MSTARRPKLISVDDYLSGELHSHVKHEYVGGFVYAMAGARNVHNVIALNITSSLHTRLRGRPCRPFNSDTKVRIRLPTETRFYYPDASISCRPNPPTDTFQDEPVAIVEVISESTRRIDEGEKKLAYQTIPSLVVYALVETDEPAVVVFRRSEEGGFAREIFHGMGATIPLSEIGIELPLAEVYETVEFASEAEEDSRTS